jgi:VPDSG-CTERM motif
MKSLKYFALIGLLCAGLSSVAHANVIDLGEADLANNGDATELQGFIDAGGDAGAVLCFKSVESGHTTFGGTITISVNADNTLHVEWDMTGSTNGEVVCGFSTKDGHGNLVHYYSVTSPDQVIGSADLIVPGNGARALSHLDVFCCAGTQVPDGGTTVILLGAALGALGMARRYIKS